MLKLLFDQGYQTSYLAGDRMDHYYAGILNKNIPFKPVYKNKSDDD